MYSSYKKKMQTSRKQTRILLLTGFAFLAAAVFFFSYRFYQRIAGSSLYSIGQGNKYVNAISSKLYGGKIEETEEESLDFSAIQTRQEEVIRNALKTLKKKREESKWSYRDPFASSISGQLERPREQNDYSNVPIVLFTALENPVGRATQLSRRPIRWAQKRQM